MQRIRRVLTCKRRMVSAERMHTMQAAGPHVVRPSAVTMCLSHRAGIHQHHHHPVRVELQEPPIFRPAPGSVAGPIYAVGATRPSELGTASTRKPVTALGIAILLCDQTVRARLPVRLKSLGHHAVGFRSLQELTASVSGGVHFDLVVCSPDLRQHWSALLTACKAHRVPLLMVGEEERRAVVAEALLGANDHFEGRLQVNAATLPLTDSSLSSWLSACVRYVIPFGTSDAPGDANVFGDYRFCGASRKVFHRNKPVHLLVREYDLALLLFSNLGRVVEREWIIQVVWARVALAEKSRVVDTCVSNVRRKLKLFGETGYEIVPVYRRGYELRETRALHLAPGQ